MHRFLFVARWVSNLMISGVWDRHAGARGQRVGGSDRGGGMHDDDEDDVDEDEGDEEEGDDDDDDGDDDGADRLRRRDDGVS